MKTLLLTTLFSLFSFILFAQPVNDQCNGAILIDVSTSIFCHNTSISATTQNATSNSTIPICGNISSTPDIWYQFTALSTTHTIRFSNVTNSSGATIQGTPFEAIGYTLYNGSCSGLTILSCKEPFAISSDCLFNYNAYRVDNLIPGEIYLLRVYPFTFEFSYSFDICIETPPPAPSNNDCATSLVLPITPFGETEQKISGTNFYATASDIDGNTSCETTNQPDVWYKFKPASKRYLLRISDIVDAYSKDKRPPQTLNGNCQIGSFLDINVYYGDCDDLLCTFSVDRDSLLELDNLIPGIDYFIKIASNPIEPSNAIGMLTPNTEFFDFKIALLEMNTSPVNDECADAVSLTMSVGGDRVLERFSTNGAAGNQPNKDDIWFTFTATEDAHLLSLLNFSFFSGPITYGLVDTAFVVELYDGSCESLTFLTTNYGNDIFNNLTIGSTYYLRIYTYLPNSIIDFDVAISELNDNLVCDNATNLQVNPWYTCSDNVQSGFIFGDKAWYKFTATSNAVLISLQNPTICTNIGCVDLGSYEDFYLSTTMELYSGTCGNLNLEYNQNNPYHQFTGLNIGQEYYFSIDSPTEVSFGNICVRTVNNIATTTSCTDSNIPSATAVQTFSGQLYAGANRDSWHRFRIGNYSPDKRFVKVELVNYADTETTEASTLQNFTFSLYQEISVDENNNGCDSLITVAENINVHEISFDRLNDESNYFIKVALEEHALLSSYVSYQLKVTQSDYPASDPIAGNCASAVLLTGANPCTPSNLLLGKGNHSFRAADFTLDADDDSFFNFLPFKTTCEITLTNENNTNQILDKDVWIEVYELNTLTDECLLESDYIIEPKWRGLGPTLKLDNLDLTKQYAVRTYSKGHGEDNLFFYRACLSYPAENNDECVDALAIAVSSTNCENSEWLDTGDMTMSDASTCKGSPNDDLWVKFIATSTSLDFDISGIFCESSALNNTIVTEVYQGSCIGLESLHCDSTSQFSVEGLVVNQEYLIRLHSYNSTHCRFNLCIKDPEINYNPSLTNDNSEEAITVYQAPVSVLDATCLPEYEKVSSFFGSSPSSEGGSLGAAFYTDIWYVFTANSTEVRIDVNSDYASGVLVYDTGFNEAFTSVITNTTHALVHSGFVVGQQYYIKLLLPFANESELEMVMDDPALLGYSLCVKGEFARDSDGEYLDGVVELPVNNNPYGYTSGNFSVSGMGASEYSIPFILPTGATGMKPELGIVYRSSGDKGILGEKFSLAGLSLISRVGQTVSQDGENIPVSFTSTDRFSLDGNRLVQYNNIAYGAENQEYRTEVNSYKKIVANGSILMQDSPESFTVYTRSGLKYEYGHSNDSQIKATGRQDVMFWAVNKIIDTNGNTIEFSYIKDESNGYFYPESIEYTYNQSANTSPKYKVYFYYESRPDIDVSYIAGSMIKVERRLKSISIFNLNTEIRSYHFTYEQDHFTNDSKLVQLQECGLNGVCFNPTTFEWEESIDFNRIDKRVIYNPLPQSTFKYHLDYTQHLIPVRKKTSENWFRTKEVTTSQGFLVEKFTVLAQDVTIDGDIDGDGLADIIVHNRVDGELTVFRNSGNYNFEEEKLSLSGIVTTFNNSGNLQIPSLACCSEGTPDGISCCETTFRNGFVQPIDVNTDGFLDLLVVDTLTGANVWYINNGSKVFQNASFTLQTDKINRNLLKRFNGTNRYLNPSDLNGDGLTDITIVGINDYIKTFINNNPSQTPLGHIFSEVFPNAPPVVFGESTFNADLNGDGKIDVFLYEEATGDCKIYQNSSLPLPNLSVDYFLASENPIPLGPITLNGPFIKPADFNGDGLIDLYLMNANPFNSKIYINKGDYLFEEVENYRVNNFPFSIVNASPLDIINAPMDVNGDGSADLVSYHNATGRFNVSINRGDGLFRNNPLTYNGDIDEFVEPSLIKGGAGIKLISYKNGNLFSFSWNDLVSGKNIIFDLNFDQRSRDIKKIITGNKQEIAIDYDFINNSNIYERECNNNYPVLDFLGNYKVVKNYTVTHGETLITDESYFYKYGKVHIAGKGFLGFKEFHTVNNLKGSKQIVYRHTDFDYRNSAIKKMEGYSPNDILTSSVEYTSELDLLTLPSGKTVCQSYHKEIIEQSFELDGSPISTIKKRQKNDDIGNAIYNVIDFGGGIIDSTYHSYGDDRSKWYLGRLISSKIYRITPTQTVQREVAFEYDLLTGVLIKEISEPNGGLKRIDKDYIFDDFGNIIQSATTAWNGSDFETRSDFSTYDANGLFQIQNSNQLEHVVKMLYENPLELKSKEIDPNGNEVLFFYDEFGRTTRIEKPDNTWKVFEYGYCDTGECPEGVYSFVEVTTNVNPSITTFYDGHGRECYMKSIGFGNKVVFNKTEFDNIGRTSRKSDPYYLGDPILWTNYFYDDLDRVTKVVSPGGITEKFLHEGLSSTYINSIGQEKTSIKTADGRLVEVIDNNNKSITYKYDPEHNVISITDCLGNIISMEYDIYGNKTVLIDPDMGTYTYSFNSFNELLTQTYPSGSMVSLKYDALGRIVEREEMEGNTVWSYDTASNGIGALASVNNYNIQENYNYDYLSRLASNTKILDGESYTQSFVYDDLGRIDENNYPGGFSTKYEYDDIGYLSKIKNNQTEEIYYSLEETDAYGSILKEKYGNDIITVNQYDPYRRDLNSRKASKSGNVLQNLVYAYDDNHNMLSRGNLYRNFTERFTYDNLNRLTSYHIPSIDTTTISYDDIGNVLTKSDVGVYHYDATSPHQLTSIDLYDPGCLIPSAVTNFEYTSYNKAKNIYNDSVSVDLRFGYNRKRIKQYTYKNKTLQETKYYIGGNLEITKLPDGATHKQYYISGPTGTIAVYNDISTQENYTHYWHKDALGSLQTVTDESGELIQDLFYDPWGVRRDAVTGGRLEELQLADSEYDRGFTGHEHLDMFALINMNGRIQDPVLARFISADPIIQDLTNMQNMNRYSYVWNNPLRYTDPSGFVGVAAGRYENSSFTGLDGQTISGTIIALDHFDKRTDRSAGSLGLGPSDWASVASVAIHIAGSAFSVPPIITGFIASFVSGLIQGGSFSDALGAGIKGAVIGQFTAAASSMVGSLTGGIENEFLKYGAKAIGHGATQGGLASMQGQNFWHGFSAGAIAGAGEAITSVFKVDNHGLMKSGSILHYSAGAAMGGLGSHIAGGNWRTGAISGVMVLAYNQNKNNPITGKKQESWLERENRLNREFSPLVREDYDKYHGDVIDNKSIESNDQTQVMAEEPSFFNEYIKEPFNKFKSSVYEIFDNITGASIPWTVKDIRKDYKDAGYELKK